MRITRDQLHEIGKIKLKKYDEWITKNPDKLSRKKLKEAVEWWRNEINEDYSRLEGIPEEDSVTYIAGFNNITVTSMLFGIVGGYYIKKLEKQLAKSLSKKRAKRV